MPRLTDNSDLDQIKLTGSYGFSATKIDDLGSSSYTLCTIAVDQSGSVEGFKKELEDCIKSAVSACKYSPRADSLMVRVVAFAHTVVEIHGFKLLSSINTDDYNNCLHLGGMTSLCDASQNAVEATIKYGQDLSKNDFDTNAIVIVITDGIDNISTTTVNMVQKSFKDAVGTEALESVMSILVGVNTNEPVVKQYLDNFNKEVGFTQMINIEKADAKSLAKLGNFISKSISATSQALGTGGPSKSLSF